MIFVVLQLLDNHDNFLISGPFNLLPVELSVCEEKNYQHLYQEHGTALRNFMYYKCGDLEKAEDLSHEAFIKMWEKCKDVIFSKAKGYLFTVANRLFLNHIEHKKVVLKFEKGDHTDRSHESPQYIMEGNEFKTKLEQAISELTEAQREAFLMNRIDKMSYQEIADTLNLSVKAVEKRIHNALKVLKNKVEELNQHKI